MNRTQLLVIGGVLGLFVFFGATGAFAYGLYKAQWESPWFRSLAGPFAVAKVDGKTVSYNDYLTLLDSGRAFLKSPAAQSEGVPADYESTVRPASYERAIRIKMIEDFAKEEQVSLTDKEIDQGFENFILQSDASSTREQAVAELNQYFGWTEDQFKAQVMRPALLEDLIFKKYEAQGKTRDDFDALVNARLSDAHVQRYLKF